MMRLPLPEANFIPGGPITAGLHNANAVTAENLANEIKRIQAQYADPLAQAKLAYQNALTQGIPSQIAQREAQTRLIGQQADLYAPKTQAEIDYQKSLTNRIPTQNALMQQQIQEQQIKNKLLPQTLQADVDAKKALATYREMGGGYGMGAPQKEFLQLSRQIQLDNPDLTPYQANQAAGAALLGKTQLEDGTPFKVTDTARQDMTIVQNRNSPAAIKNQSVNMDVLASDLNDIDITPVTKFAGLEGKANYAKYSTAMALGQEVPQEFRDYLAFKNVTRNFAMDALRKGFGTSVVPGYVYATLGKASDPSAIWWHDPQQVKTDWNATKKWINENARKYKIKATQGVAADVTSNNSLADKLRNSKSAQEEGIAEVNLKDPLGIR